MSEEENISKENIEKENSLPDQQVGKPEGMNENISQEQPIEKPETTIPKSEIQKPETENMEVHHHPNLHHRKKHWREYFLEFLMIFLAVTLGFFAENLRENISDNKKEKEFIKSLTDDLKKDTAEFPKIFFYQNRLLISMDSCLKIQPEQLTNIDEQDKFYPYFVFVYSWVEIFSANDNAYTQLRNAGEFNLVHNQAVLDSIGLFYKFYERFLKGNTDYYTTFYNRFVDVASQIIKLPMLPVDENDSVFTQIPNHIKMFTHTDDISVEQLYSWIRNLQGTLLLVIANEKIYLNRAKNLINFLKAKYNLQ